MSKRLTTNDFIELCRIVHDNLFDYSKVIYTKARDKVIIICSIHGEFEQIAYSHMKGRGCSHCSAKAIAKSRSDKIASKYVSNAQKLHGDRYDLSDVVYTGAKQTVTPKCRIHGLFNIRSDVFAKGGNCRKCISDQLREDTSSTTPDFICKSQILHGGTYDYTAVDYVNSITKITIQCSKHGAFEQIPNSHLSGHGCPKCTATQSLAEKEIIQWLHELDVGNILESDRTLISPKELDMVLSDHKLAIEYCGTYWHGERAGRMRSYHLDKLTSCKKKGYTLITIFEDEWMLQKDVVKSRLLQLLGKTGNRIYARSCIIKDITYKQAKDFLDTNHTQRSDRSSIRLGLYQNDELVSVMTFCAARFSKSYQWELSRFCSTANTSVVGAAGKLFTHFIRNHQPSSVVSYADRRWGDGSFYQNLGFVHTHDSDPNYWYTNAPVSGIRRESRIKYQKHKLVKEGFDNNMSEWEIMKSRGYDRIWDCGNSVWGYISDEITN
jgi:hypothetical protein